MLHMSNNNDECEMVVVDKGFVSVARRHCKLSRHRAAIDWGNLKRDNKQWFICLFVFVSVPPVVSPVTCRAFQMRVTSQQECVTLRHVTLTMLSFEKPELMCHCLPGGFCAKKVMYRIMHKGKLNK